MVASMTPPVTVSAAGLLRLRRRGLKSLTSTPTSFCTDGMRAASGLGGSGLGNLRGYAELRASLCRVIVMPSPRLTIQTLAVLSAMVRDPTADWYGLQLSKQARLKPGTIYPILDRLLNVGWLERRWEDIDPATEGRPKRRLYRLTGVGAPAARMALDEHLASLRDDRPAVNPAPRPRPRPA